MKLKHWQGYGTVNAQVVAKGMMDNEEYVSRYAGKGGYGNFKYPNSYDSTIEKTVVRVIGNHEYGLVREDMYDLYNWLVKRFVKNTEREYFLGYTYESDYTRNAEKGIDEEYCDYTFFTEKKE